MTKKSENLIKDWSMESREEQRIAVTARLQFPIYAKLHALKSAFPKRSVNEIINDVLLDGLDDIIESIGEPLCETQEFIEEMGCLVDIPPNTAYVFDYTFRQIMRDGKTSSPDKKEKDNTHQNTNGESS
jgi:hypothetical protein